jgi:hypothetical protein
MAHALKVSKSPADLAVERRLAAIDRTRGMLASLTDGRSLSNELIAQRRAEARAEDLEDEVYRKRRAGR